MIMNLYANFSFGRPTVMHMYDECSDYFGRVSTIELFLGSVPAVNEKLQIKNVQHGSHLIMNRTTGFHNICVLCKHLCSTCETNNANKGRVNIRPKRWLPFFRQLFIDNSLDILHGIMRYISS